MHSLGKLFQVTLFGESHSEQMGLTINGIAPGIKINLSEIESDLKSRRPSLKSETARQEQDDFKIISGYFEGYTTGAPLTIIVENKDVNSKSYDHLKDVFRPSHADYPAYVHYDGYNDYRGGGMFSGRLSVLLVIAGSIAKSILSNLNIKICTRIKTVRNYDDEHFSDNFDNDIRLIKSNLIPVISKTFEKEVMSVINDVKASGDSLGAILESKITGVEVGIGEPYFNKLDSTLANNIMSIPAIKGVSFGKGFASVNSLGSEYADEYCTDGNMVKTSSNNSGGIVGGMATGMPIIINTIVKPTPSINKELQTVNKEFINTTLKTKGRHDSSIFTRIPIVIDSMIALAILDLYTIRYGYMIQTGVKKCLD